MEIFSNRQDRLNLLAPLSPTIAGTIVKILQPIVKRFQANFSHDCDNKVPKLPIAIPLRRVPTQGYRYVSAIAHTLAARSQLPPLTIAETLHSDCSQLTLDLPKPLVIQLSIGETGYLYWDLTSIAIATWLEYLHQAHPTPDRPIVSHPADRVSLDRAIYARARCRSGLRLAQSQGFIDLDLDWQITNPPSRLVFGVAGDPSIDLLQPCQQAILSSHFRLFEDSTEQALIHAFMDVLDGIYSDRQIDPAKLAIDLAQAWLEFHRYCRIWGDVKTHQPRLAIARCGLTAIAGRYLQVLLEDYLGVSAPLEF